MISMAVQWRHHEVLDAQSYALGLVRRASALHAQRLDATAGTLRQLASLRASHALPDNDVLGALTASPQVEGLDTASIHTPDGVLLAHRGTAPLDAIVRRPFFAQAVQTGLPAVDDYEIDLQTRRATTALAYPAQARAGVVDRVIVGVLEVGWLGDMDIHSELGAGALVLVFDDAGHRISHVPAGAESFADQGDYSPLIQAALRSREEGAIDHAAFDGVMRTYAYGPLQDAHTGRAEFIAVGIPTAAATAIADRTLAFNFIGFTVTLVLVMGGAAVAGDRLVVRHVRALAGVAERLGRGDENARAGTEGRPTELAGLAFTFDKMADALVARQREVVRQRDRAAALEKKARAILDNLDEGVSVRDAAGRFTYVSPAITRILGRDPQELVGRQADEWVHPEDLEALHGMTAALLEQPERRLSGTLRVHHRDGTWRWVACDVVNMLAEPAVAGLLATYRDVTAYRDAQEQLREARDELERRVHQRTAALVRANEALESEIAERKRTQESLQKWSHAIEQTADSVFVTDRKGVIEYVNPAFETMTGYARAEVIGQTPRLLSSGLHDRKFFDALWTTLLSGRVFRSVVTNKTKDGRLFDEDQTITPMTDAHGVITHFVATGRDITERKRTELAVRRLNHLLEQETARIAGLLHDEAGQFLTSAHIMLADIGRDVPNETRERLQAVRRHLEQVEQQLRTISHDLHPRILTELGLMGTLRFRAESFSRRTGIRVTVDSSREYGLSAAIDAVVYRVVQEALTNIGKHAAAASATISLRDDGHHLTCTVQDDGQGFDVGQNADSGAPAGLGLQNMKDRVEAVGGTLTIESAPGDGTRVTAVLPLEDSYGSYTPGR